MLILLINDDSAGLNFLPVHSKLPRRSPGTSIIVYHRSLNSFPPAMFAFAKQLVRSTEAIISQNAGLPPTQYNTSQSEGYDNYRGAAAYVPPSPKRDDPKYGFRVLRVTPHSKCDKSGVESLFDFVVGVGGVDIEVLQRELRVKQEREDEARYGGLQSVVEENEQEDDAGKEEKEKGSGEDGESNNNEKSETTPPLQEPSKRHRRGRLSFSSMSGIITPQIKPPEPELAPIDVFMDVLRSYEDTITLDLWSSKGRRRRSIVLTLPDPEAIEKGEGDQSEILPGGFWLGLTLQWTPLAVADHVWHVLSVAPDSPAEAAGLLSHSDYIVGAENGLLEAGGEDLLGRVVQRLVLNHASQRREQQFGDPVGPGSAMPTATAPASGPAVIVNSVPELELYVYNYEYDVLRAVRIRPNSRWGGSGLLGCNIGYGLLHRLPGVASQAQPASSTPSPTKPSKSYPGLGISLGGRPPAVRRGHSRSFSGSFSVAAGSLPPGGLLFDSSMAEEDEDAYLAEDEQKQHAR